MSNSLQVIDISKLSPLNELVRAAKAVLNDHQDIDRMYESTEKVMEDLKSAIRDVELEPGASGWIIWRGGYCPVPPDAVVDISRPNGIRERQIAGHYIWHHQNDDCDITAYRLSSELAKIREKND